MKCISCLHGINIPYDECTNAFIAYFKVGRMCGNVFLYIFYGALVPNQVRDETECLSYILYGHMQCRTLGHVIILLAV